MIIVTGLPTGLTDVFVCVYNNSAQVRDVVAGAWDAFAIADLDDYDIALTETGDSGVYTANDPTLPAGRYILKVYRGTPASQSITHYLLGSTEQEWDGSGWQYTIDNDGRVNVGQWLDSAVTKSTGNLPDVNAAEISDASAAADSVEANIGNLDRAVSTAESNIRGADSDTLKTLSDQLDDVLTTGPGDYEVTLTIRTTGGDPIAGVGVWLNTSSDRSGAVSGTVYTDDGGIVTFYLDYGVTYNVFCHLAGYTFEDTTIVPAAGLVTFTKDIATAVSSSSVAGTFYDESFLSRTIDLTRTSINEPSVNAKYSDSDIIDKLEQLYPVVLAEINRNNQTPIVATMDITIASGVTKYLLPPNAGPIHAVYDKDTFGQKVFYNSASRLNPTGRNVWIEGSTLNIQYSGLIDAGKVLTVEYLPKGTARLHNGICTLNSDGDEATIAATPNKGTLDTHKDAYVGSVLRIINVTGTGATGNYIQERTITSYEHTTRVATLEKALDPVPVAGSGGSILYEIAPIIHKGLDSIIAMYAAYTICGIEGNSNRTKALQAIYRDSLRMLRLTAYYSQIAESVKQRADNYDSDRFRRI